MPSIAYEQYLLPLLNDAIEIEDAHKRLRTGNTGRQWGLGALNRAAVVMCLSSWEAYVEELVKESVASFKPSVPANTLWQSINADARAQIGRFNTPGQSICIRFAILLPEPRVKDRSSGSGILGSHASCSKSVACLIGLKIPSSGHAEHAAEVRR
jgi:hypothetical protein